MNANYSFKWYGGNPFQVDFLDIFEGNETGPTWVCRSARGRSRDEESLVAFLLYSTTFSSPFFLLFYFITYYFYRRDYLYLRFWECALKSRII